MSKEICGPIALAAACGVTGLGLGTRWQAAASWLALALIGQASALQLVEAGHSLMRYQHYPPLARLLHDAPPVLLICLALQAVLVLRGLRRRVDLYRAWLRSNVSWWQLAGLAAAFVLPAAAVSREVSAYVQDLVTAVLIQGVNLGNVLLFATALPESALAGLGRKLERLLGPVDDGSEGPRVDRFALFAALWVTVVAALLSVWVYQDHPHIPDEMAYLYHARFFANGVLSLPAPPVPDGFLFYLMEVSGTQWYPSPPPGWPLALAVGVLLGVQWLVNPALAGINVLLAYVLMRALYDRRVARMVALLLCVSPWHIFMAMNFMTHTFTLTCALAGAVFLVWARQSGRAPWGGMAGAAVGMVSLIRPLEGVIVGGLLGLRAIGVGGERLRLPIIAAFVLGTVVVGASQLGYNAALTGDPTLFPINAYTDRYFGKNSNAYGFGPDRGMGWPLDPHPGHSPRDAVINANLNGFSLNIELFGWGTGSLLLAAFMVLGGTLSRGDYAMLAMIAAIFTAQFFYYFSGGPDFGARYWYLMIVPLLALTARGIRCLEARLNGTRLLLAVGSLCLVTVVTYFPWRAVDKYYRYLNMRPDIRALARDRQFGRSLVLVRGVQFPDYVSAAIYNPLDLQANAPIYAWDRNETIRAQLLAAYPDRDVWIVAGPTVTRDGFRVLAGPLSVADLQKQNGTPAVAP